MHSLDVSTTNLVNASTPGFRAETAVFREVLAKAALGAPSPSVVVRTTAPDMTVGQLVSTGNKLDVAIPDKEGFFTLQTPDGPRYTRAGNFKLGGDGGLVSAEGVPVLGTDGRPINLPPGSKDVTIDRSGTVIVDGERQQTLAVVRFPNPDGLEKAGGVQLKARPEAGRPAAYDATVEPGALELSNEDATAGMADEVSNSREFEMTMRVVEAFRDVERNAANKIMNK
jgi:flagellar basal-body rod protein FlgF